MKYARLRTGRDHKWFEIFKKESFVGVSYGLDVDISGDLYPNWKDFNRIYIDEIINRSSEPKSRVAAGLNCGVIWTLSKGLEINDILMCQDKEKNYHFCKISSDYYYNEDAPHHRRKVEWLDRKVLIEELPTDLKKSINAQNTLTSLTKYSHELENLIQGISKSQIISQDPDIEEPSEFALEEHLEEFLIKNWKSTLLGKNYDLYMEDGEIVGQQYPSDTGPIDILAISKDRKTILVVELKKGRVSDKVVGQIQRYMGYVKEELCEADQNVKGIIIGLDDDNRIKRALAVTTNIEFYRYVLDFKLSKTK